MGCCFGKNHDNLQNGWSNDNPDTPYSLYNLTYKYQNTTNSHNNMRYIPRNLYGDY